MQGKALYNFSFSELEISVGFFTAGLIILWLFHAANTPILLLIISFL